MNFQDWFARKARESAEELIRLRGGKPDPRLVTGSGTEPRRSGFISLDRIEDVLRTYPFSGTIFFYPHSDDDRHRHICAMIADGLERKSVTCWRIEPDSYVAILSDKDPHPSWSPVAPDGSSVADGERLPK